LPKIATVRKFAYSQEEVTMPDSPGSVAALFGCQYSAFCKRCRRCADDLILTIGHVVLGNLCAHIEFRSVLMDQPMRMNLVAVLVAAHLDPNVTPIHATSAIGRRDFIQWKCNAFESTTPMLKRAAIGELGNHQGEWLVIHKRHFGVAIAMLRREDSAWLDSQSGGTNDLVRAVLMGAPFGAERAALVEECRVLMHQPMGMELVTIGVTADPDKDVPFAIGRRDFIQCRCNALESTIPMLKFAAIGEVVNHQGERKRRGGVAIAMLHIKDNAWLDGRSGGTNDLVLAVLLGAPFGAERAALVEECRVLMHQPMGMELVAIFVTANPDEDVPFCVVVPDRLSGHFRQLNRHEAVSTTSFYQRPRK